MTMTEAAQRIRSSGARTMANMIMNPTNNVSIMPIGMYMYLAGDMSTMPVNMHMNPTIYILVNPVDIVVTMVIDMKSSVPSGPPVEHQGHFVASQEQRSQVLPKIGHWPNRRREPSPDDSTEMSIHHQPGYGGRRWRNRTT